MTNILILTSVATLVLFLLIVTMACIMEIKFNKVFRDLQDVCEQLEIKFELEKAINAMPPGKDK